MIESIAYGKKSTGSYYVQSTCNEEHKGQSCACQSFGEDFSEQEAKNLANAKANELNVTVEAW